LTSVCAVSTTRHTGHAADQHESSIFAASILASFKHAFTGPMVRSKSLSVRSPSTTRSDESDLFEFEALHQPSPSLQDFAFFHNMMLYINRKTMPMLWVFTPFAFLFEHFSIDFGSQYNFLFICEKVGALRAEGNMRCFVPWTGLVLLKCLN